MAGFFTHRLHRKAKLSRKQSEEMIITMTRFGDHVANLLQGFPISTDEEVTEWFEKNGYNYGQIIEECRNPQISIPLVENLVGGTFIMSGREESEQIITSTYQDAYEVATRHLEGAIENASFSEIESAIVRGIASIEAFINTMASKWNERNPNSRLEDSRDNKVSLDDKIDIWIPRLSGGQAFNKGDKHWQDFKRLRGIRDNLTVHAKQTGHIVKYSEMAELINAFRTGIAGVLIRLHILCRNWIPSEVIRGYYTPEVEVVPTTD
jgi:hypothetical protein